MMALCLTSENFEQRQADVPTQVLIRMYCLNSNPPSEKESKIRLKFSGLGITLSDLSSACFLLLLVF